MPIQFLGHKEYVYQACVSAYFTVASDTSTALNHRNKSAWSIQVEKNAEISRTDLILHRMGNDTRVLHEFKQVPFTPKDKQEHYGDSQHKQLTKNMKEALVQLETRQYCTLMKDHVTKLHKYGLAFLGPYCVVVGCSFEQKQGGAWIHM